MVDGPNGNGSAVAEVNFDEAEVRALEAEATILLARMQFMRQAGISFKGMRDLYDILGYDRNITHEQYRERYERGGVAGTIVDVMVDAVWRGGMELIEDEDPENDTPFEAAWKELEERLNLTTYMIRADRLSRLSDYAVMLIGTSLNGELTSELPKGRPENLIYLQPYSGAGGPTRDGRQSQTTAMDARAKIASYERDTKNPRYGQPATYNLRVDDGQWIGDVHWSRIVHVAEGCLDDDVFGRSVLKRTWNLLDDLDKVTGGGAEAFWLRANQGMHVDIDKDMQLEKGEFATVVEKLKAQSEAYKHQQTRWLSTRGTKVTPLGSDVANFANPADAVLKQISGATRIPTRILTGSEMGQLASSQDRENFKDQVNGRQEQHAGPNIVRKLVDRLIEFGYMPEPAEGPRKYRVKWAHIQTLTEEEKVAGAKGWASVNQAQGEVVFTNAEIREKWADKAPLTKEQLQEIADRAAEKLKLQQDAMGAQPAAVDPKTGQPVKRNPFMKAAEEAYARSIGVRTTALSEDEKLRAVQDVELLRVLEAAIVAGNEDVIHQIIGLQDGPHKLSSTQIDLPEEWAKPMIAFGANIPDDDIYMPEGREDRPHVTVKYGLPADASAPDVAGFGPVRIVLGPLDVFATPDYDVLFASVDSPDLVRLNSLIGQTPGVTDTHPNYRPHATIAYLKSGYGVGYVGRKFVEVPEGSSFTADAMTFVSANGTRERVSLLDMKTAGDVPGHEFHGNQWTEGRSSVTPSSSTDLVKQGFSKSLANKIFSSLKPGETMHVGIGHRTSSGRIISTSASKNLDELKDFKDVVSVTRA